MTKVLPGILRCPHCSIARPLLRLVWEGNLTKPPGATVSWAVFSCTNCTGLVSAKAMDNLPLNLNYPEKLFPSPRSASSEIPQMARTFLQQAMDTLHAPDAAAVMAGSAIDAMLKDKGFEVGSVYTRIDKAVEDRVLTQGMADWAHSVRLGANRPRHADRDAPHVSSDEAARSVEFAEALGEFLYVLSAKIRRGVDAAANVDVD